MGVVDTDEKKSDEAPTAAVAAEPDEKATSTKKSSQGAFGSLLGLVVIGLLVWYGLPYLSDAIQGVTKSGDKTEEVDQADGGGEEIVKTEVKGEVSGVESGGAAKSGVDQEALDVAATEGITQMIKPGVRHQFEFRKAVTSKKGDAVRVTFVFDGNTYHMVFRKNEEFGHFQSEDVHPELVKVFSGAAPSFEAP